MVPLGNPCPDKESTVLTINNPRHFAGLMLCACLASFALGLALPLPIKRAALVSPDGATLAQGLAPQACRAMLAEYPQGMGWTCL